MAITFENQWGDIFNVGSSFVFSIDVPIDFTDVLVGDLLFAVLTFDDSAGTGFANFPTDDAGNAWDGGNICDIVPNIEGAGQDAHVYWTVVTSQISIGQEVHFTYGGVGAAPGSAWDLYHLRGAAAPSVFTCNHVDLGGDVWHDVGDCTPATSLAATGAGVAWMQNWIITPYVAYSGDPTVITSFSWNDMSPQFGRSLAGSAWDSDPDGLAQYGFDTTRAVGGFSPVAAAGSIDVAGCWDVSQDSYRGAYAIFFAESGVVPPPPPTPTSTGIADIPALDVCGIEISNPARAWTYLKNGLGSAGWKFGTDCIPPVYFAPNDSELVFTDPAGSDGGSPAPWFDPDHPDSEEFLGLILTSLDGFDSTVSRSVTQRAGGIQGGSIGAQHLDARPITGHGFLVAASCCGLEFGKRWLINTLSSNPCDPCGLCDITAYTCSPTSGSDADPDEGRWTLYDVALVDGPHETDRNDCCDWAEIDFTLTAGNPFLYKQKQTCVEATVIQPDAGGSDCIPFADWFCGPPSDKICCTITPPLIGTLGAIITIDASSGSVGGVEVGTYLTCPPGDSDEPGFSLVIPLLVQGSVLVIDSARRVITYTAPDGTVMDGTQFIQFPEGRSMDWIEVSDCSPASCICVNALHPCSGGDQTYVTIQTQQRVR